MSQRQQFTFFERKHVSYKKIKIPHLPSFLLGLRPRKHSFHVERKQQPLSSRQPLGRNAGLTMRSTSSMDVAPPTMDGDLLTTRYLTKDFKGEDEVYSGDGLRSSSRVFLDRNEPLDSKIEQFPPYSDTGIANDTSTATIIKHNITESLENVPQSNPERALSLTISLDRHSCPEYLEKTIETDHSDLLLETLEKDLAITPPKGDLLPLAYQVPAFASSGSISAQMGTKIISIQVGPENTLFTVHKTLLFTTSEFFPRAFAYTDTIALPAESPSLFAMYVDWMYQRRVPHLDIRASLASKNSGTGQANGNSNVQRTSSRISTYSNRTTPVVEAENTGAASADSDPVAEDVFTLAAFYAFAERLQLSFELRNRVLDELRRTFKEAFSCAEAGFLPSLVRVAYVHSTRSRSPLRRFATEAALGCFDNLLEEEVDMFYGLCREREDVGLDFFASLRDLGGWVFSDRWDDALRPDPDRDVRLKSSSAPCRFHMHGKGEKCYLAEDDGDTEEIEDFSSTF